MPEKTSFTPGPVPDAVAEYIRLMTQPEFEQFIQSLTEVRNAKSNNAG